MRSVWLSSLFLSSPLWAQSAATVGAHEPFPLPLAPVAADPRADALRFEPVTEAVRALAELRSVVLTDVALPGGDRVDLELERIPLERLKIGYQLDGAPAPRIAESLRDAALSVWSGRVVGRPGSEVQLSFSLVGSRGWIHDGERLVHVLPRPSSDGDWTRGDVLFASDATLANAGATYDETCGYAQAAAQQRSSGAQGATTTRAAGGPSASGPGSAQLGGAACPRECTVAMTTDFQLYQRFNNLTAETAYVTTLLGWINDRYLSQINAVLTFPYLAFYSTAADPWTTPDTGGTSGNMLDELRTAWLGAIPTGATIAHMMSGASLGGGVAYLNVLCNPDFAFGVSGNISGATPFPIAVGPSNWDFMVVAHEIGHNFNAIHTHDYCPPLDQCPPSQYFGACQTAQVCTNQGTIMSYCHLCSGGTSNITTFFHAQSAADMSAAADGCLPCWFSIDGDAPLTIAPNTPTVLSARVDGFPTAGVQLQWRLGTSGAFNTLAMTHGTLNTWSATLPPIACGQNVQFYYEFNEATVGVLRSPASAPATPFSADSLIVITTYSDDLESDLGWTTSVAGATAGQWQRGVPVNDAGWAYDPATDGDGSGQCWLTQNAAGNTDVDNGSVILVSPAIDFSAPLASLEYRYYLALTNTNGADRLLVEASSNGTGGPWTTIATHTGDTGGGWVSANVSNATFASLGVTLNSSLRLRFTANDGGTQSVVEAGVDALAVRGGVCPALTAYCAGDGSAIACPCGNNGALGRGCANSTFANGAALSASGIASVTVDSVSLSASNMTGSIAVFFQGATQTAHTVIDDGLGCVGGPIIRLGSKATVASASSYPQAGDPLVSVRGAIPAAGGTYFYQCFYRNAVAAYCPPATSNRTNGIQIAWTP